MCSSGNCLEVFSYYTHTHIHTLKLRETFIATIIIMRALNTDGKSCPLKVLAQ